MIHLNGRFSKSEDVRAELKQFNEDASANIRKLHHRLSRGKFIFEKAKGIPIPKLNASGKLTGKYRPIVLAPVESRIVQRAVLEVLLAVPGLQPYIRTKLSFGGLRALTTDDGMREGPSLSAVPAAIQAALAEIGGGATHFASADIQSFFTKIPRSTVHDIVVAATDDVPFVDFFEKAISAELENMAALREKADLFPTEDVGVAQGNSLSPLLGNIVLADFDEQMNEGSCACIRYVDDFIIFGPSAKAVNRRLRKAQSLLSTLGMQLSPEKSSSGAVSVDDGFEFLGIEVCPGLIRPSNRAQRTLLAKVEEILDDGKRALVELREAHHLQREKSLLAILRRVDSTITGWGKHYRFCNDGQVFDAMDRRIWTRVRQYLGCYSDVRNNVGEELRPLALGIGQLRLFERVPLSYPKTIKR